MTVPAPPPSLPAQLHERWEELAAACVRLGTFAAGDEKDLERFVILSWEYDAITPKVLTAISHGDSQEADRWVSVQAKLSAQIRLLSAQFGLGSQVAKARMLPSIGSEK